MAQRISITSTPKHLRTNLNSKTAPVIKMTTAHHHHLSTRQSMCDMLCSEHYEFPISQKTTPSLEPLVKLTSMDQIHTYRRPKRFSLTAITNTTWHQEKEGLDPYKTNILEQWNFGSPRFGLRHTSSTIIETRNGIKQFRKHFLTRDNCCTQT